MTAALDRAPTDEAALRGRADVLAGGRSPGRGGRDARSARGRSSTRRAAGRCLRCGPTGPRARRIARAAARPREPRRPAADERPDDRPPPRRSAGRSACSRRVPGRAIAGPADARPRPTPTDGDEAIGAAADEVPAPPLDPAVLTLAVETALEAGRTRRGSAAGPRGRGRASRGRRVPRRDGRLLPGASPSRRPTRTSTSRSRSCISIAAGADRPPTSWSSSGAWHPQRRRLDRADGSSRRDSRTSRASPHSAPEPSRGSRRMTCRAPASAVA